MVCDPHLPGTIFVHSSESLPIFSRCKLAASDKCCYSVRIGVSLHSLWSCYALSLSSFTPVLLDLSWVFSMCYPSLSLSWFSSKVNDDRGKIITYADLEFYESNSKIYELI